MADPTIPKQVALALYKVASIGATEGGRAAAAWLEVVNALAPIIGVGLTAAAQPPDLNAPLLNLPSGNSALDGPRTGVSRKAIGSQSGIAPAIQTGGRLTQSGPRARR